MHHLRNLTDENASSSNGSGSAGGDDELSAFNSHAHGDFSVAAAAARAACVSDAAAVSSSIAALGERQRQCHSIVNSLTEQQQQLHQAIEDEVSRARAQAVEAASEWSTGHANCMRVAQQQLQATHSLPTFLYVGAPCAHVSSNSLLCRPSSACAIRCRLLRRLQAAAAAVHP